MVMSKTIVSFFTFIVILNSCTPSAKINSIKVVEQNGEKKYVVIRTKIFRGEASLLKDTTNEYNRYPPEQAARQYLPSFADIQLFEDVLKARQLYKTQLVSQGGKSFIKYYKGYKRQYSGYIDKMGDTILMICFLDFRRKNESKEIFFNWKYQNSFFGSIVNLHKRTPGVYCYSYNINTKQLSKYNIQHII
jgi:hypothetical protein